MKCARPVHPPALSRIDPARDLSGEDGKDSRCRLLGAQHGPTRRQLQAGATGTVFRVGSVALVVFVIPPAGVDISVFVWYAADRRRAGLGRAGPCRAGPEWSRLDIRASSFRIPVGGSAELRPPNGGCEPHKSCLVDTR